MNDSAKALARQILDNYLETNNHRKTPERYAILDAIYSIDGHFTLEDLGEKLNGECHFPVSRATLYNTLRLFLELRLVIRHNFQGTTKYEACYDSDSHCHLICTVCGKVTEVKSPEVTEAIGHIPLGNFSKDGYTLYIYGTCGACKDKADKAEGNNEQNNQNKQQ